MTRKLPVIWLECGRDFYRGRDWHIGVSALRRTDSPPGEYAYRWNFNLSWDWPRISFHWFPPDKKESRP